MLVQLSPWQSCSTSVPISTKRRRKQSDASTFAYDLPLEFEASLVTSTKRIRHKKKLKRNSGSNEEPTVTITSSHRVCIVGQSSHSRAGAEAGGLQECSQWQFQSRPGKSTSFLQQVSTSINGSKQPQHHVTRIPAILDARNDQVYALQHENATLSCWNAETSSGPEDVDAPAVKVSLSSPAMCMSFLPFQSGIAYGTCHDGRLFVATWTAGDHDDKQLTVEYSEQLLIDKTCHHVCTFVVSAASTGSEPATSSKSGRKRKASQEQHGGEFVFYQVFAKDTGIVIYRRKANLMEQKCLEDETNGVQASFVDLVSTLEESNGVTVDPCAVSVSQVDESKIAVMYSAGRATNGKSTSNKTLSQQRHYCATIELETGSLTRRPFVLANYTRHAGAVTPYLLAVATLDEVLLYDMAHGSIVHRVVVTDLVGDCKNWSLIAEAKKGRLAVLSVQNGHAQVSFTKATLNGMSYQQAQQEGNEYSIAIGLRSSLGVPSMAFVDESMGSSCGTTSLLDLTSAVEDSAERRVDDSVTEALVRLRSCIDEIQDPDNRDIQPFHFMKVYEQSVISILSASPTSPKKKRKTLGSPKFHTKKASMANGMHHAEASDSTQDTEETSTASKHEEANGSAHFVVNGLKVPNTVRGFTPPSLPQRFIDGAISIVLSVLQLPQTENKAIGIRSKLARLDARLILSRLIRTGKVSARRHFDTSLDHGHGGSNDEDTGDCFFAALRSLKLTKKGSNRVFSPVDLMHEMISCCPDISEGQMITMIHFMLCKALPEDIAENFLDHGNLKPGHPYRVLAKRFVQVRSALRKQQATTQVGNGDVSQLKEQEESLSLKLVRAGTTILVGRLMQYSRCNETLLRNAISEGLTAKHEPAILSRVLIDLLNHRGENAILPPISTALISKWIFTLCEACRERLVASEDTSDESDDESPLTQILDSVRADVKSTETIMSLHDMVHQFGTTKAEQIDAEAEETGKLTASDSHKRDATPVPAYSIERLAF